MLTHDQLEQDETEMIKIRCESVLTNAREMYQPNDSFYTVKDLNGDPIILYKQNENT